VTRAVPALPDNAKHVLLGADCRPYLSTIPGQLGGHRRGKLYGRLDCPAALRAIAAGGYVRHRVFFADEATAVTAGYRPCAACLPDAYRKWKSRSLSHTRGTGRPDDLTFQSPPASSRRCSTTCRALTEGGQ
jgi:Metal binding domain of Ada